MVLDDLIISDKKEIIEAMRKIDSNGIGIVVIVNEEGVVCGTLSDGDIRRAIIRGMDVNEQRVSEIMRKDPIILNEKDFLNKINVNSVVHTLFERCPKGGFIPVTNNQGNIIDLLHFSEPKRESYIETRQNNNFPIVKNVKRVLIVGGAGYLGSILVRKLLERGYYTRILDSFLFGKESINEIKDHPNLEVVDGDVRNIATVSDALHNVDAVAHLAAIVGDPACKSQPLDTIETNYLATKILAEACKYRQINRLIFASTCSVYGQSKDSLDEESPLNPLSLYAKSKIKSEEGILGLVDKNFSPCIMRMGTLYGLSPRMRFDLVVNTLTMKAVIEKKITIFGGDQWRPLLHVDDAAEAYIKCLESPIEFVRGQVFNVGSNEQNVQIIKLGKLIKEIIPESEIEITHQEINQGQLDQRDYHVSFEKIKKDLNFSTKKNIIDGIFEIKKMLENGEIKNAKDPKYYNLIT